MFQPEIMGSARHSATGTVGIVVGLYQDRSGCWSARLEWRTATGAIDSHWFAFGELEAAPPDEA